MVVVPVGGAVPGGPPRPSLASRVEALEAEVARLAAELAEMRRMWS